MKYTFSDEEEGGSDAPSTRRSNRHSGVSTPAEPAGPTFTASGRQVRSRYGGAYGETMLSGQQDDHGSSRTIHNGAVDDEGGEGEEGGVAIGRTRGASSRNSGGQNLRSRARIGNYNAVDGMDDESDATSSGGDWDGGDDDDEVDEHIGEGDDEDTDMSDDNASDALGDIDTNTTGQKRDSLVVSLRYQQKKPQLRDPAAPANGSLDPTITQILPPTALNGHPPQPTILVAEDLKDRQPLPPVMKEPCKANFDQSPKGVQHLLPEHLASNV